MASPFEPFDLDHETDSMPGGAVISSDITITQEITGHQSTRVYRRRFAGAGLETTAMGIDDLLGELCEDDNDLDE